MTYTGISIVCMCLLHLFFVNKRDSTVNVYDCKLLNGIPGNEDKLHGLQRIVFFSGQLFSNLSYKVCLNGLSNMT